MYLVVALLLKYIIELRFPISVLTMHFKVQYLKSKNEIEKKQIKYRHENGKAITIHCMSINHIMS